MCYNTRMDIEPGKPSEIPKDRDADVLALKARMTAVKRPRTEVGMVRAYDHTGYEQQSIEVMAGDIVEWKRNGQRGSIRCRVLGFEGGKIHMQPLNSRTGEDAGRWVSAYPSINKAWRGGKLLGLPKPFESVVAEYESDPKSAWRSITCPRPGHRDVFMNHLCRGFPAKPLCVGDRVRISTVQVDGEDHAEWVIEPI